jgi:hypothetical protein
MIVQMRTHLKGMTGTAVVGIVGIVVGTIVHMVRAGIVHIVVDTVVAGRPVVLCIVVLVELPLLVAFHSSYRLCWLYLLSLLSIYFVPY